MSTRTNVIERNGHTKTNLPKPTSLWSRAITKSEWTDKVSVIHVFVMNNGTNQLQRIKYFLLIYQEEFLDVIYWARQVLGILIGIVWGVIPLKGFIAIALYGNSIYTTNRSSTTQTDRFFIPLLHFQICGNKLWNHLCVLFEFPASR